VKIIQNDHNLGLGKASNQGIEATNGRYILLLNNDTIVNGPSFEAMVHFMEQHPRVAAVGGCVLNPDGSIQSCYNNFSSLGEEFLIATRIGEIIRPGYPAVTVADDIKSVDWITSACLMLRREALDQVGLLDESYFIYGDEEDLQLRLKKAGWEIYYLPEASIIHYGGRSMNRWSRRKLVYRGKILFFQKALWGIPYLDPPFHAGGIKLIENYPLGVCTILPKQRERSIKEIKSNLDVVGVCLRPS